MNTEELFIEETVVPKAPKKSNGQIFKEKTGHSKTMKSNIFKASRRLGLEQPMTIEEYRKLRASARPERAKLKRAKHNKALAGRITGKVKSKGKKGKKQDSKTQN